MPRKVIDINSAELIKFSKKLDLMHRSKLPNAVRNTLNEMAFTTKRLIPEEAEKVFEVRSKSFFKAFSQVQKATGFDINTMAAKAGMKDARFGGKSEQAGRNQTQQQISGTIGGRTFVPLDTARTSNSNKKRVRAKDRLSRINIVMDSSISNASTAKKRFVQTSIQAVKKHNSAIIKHRRDDGKEFLYRVQRGGSDIQTREFNIKVTPLYSVKKGRSVNVDAKPYTKMASLRASRNRDKIFIRQAKRQINSIRR